MKSLRCFLGLHDPQGWATKPGVFGAGRCSRCGEAVGGIAIETPASLTPRAAPKPKRRGVPVWLHAIHEGKRAAQR